MSKKPILPPPEIIGPLQGKTYSLFGDADSTQPFYERTDAILRILLRHTEEKELLNELRRASKSRKQFFLWKRRYAGEIDFPAIEKEFSQYWRPLETHLKSLSIIKRFDNTIAKKDFQYFLNFIEFALTNKINRPRFNAANYRIALLPHCLRDLSKECKAKSDGIDLLCGRCSKQCYIRHVSEHLSDMGTTPYIWMELDLKRILREKVRKYDSVGVLGIACVPELVNGMRRCEKYGIPAIGLPLDANRCRRWMGSFNPNSINIERLHQLFM